MSCGEYQVHDKHGNPKAIVAFDDTFAKGFPRLRRIGDAPCAGDPVPAASGLQRIASYVKAEVGLLVKGKVAAEVYESRIAACLACPDLVPIDEDPVGLCGACGCGTRRRARLGGTKAWMPDATCPRRRW